MNDDDGWVLAFKVRWNECDPALGCEVCSRDHCDHTVFIKTFSMGTVYRGLHEGCRGYGAVAKVK